MSVPWDESTRPRGPEADPGFHYTEHGRMVGQHLVDVHDMLRGELSRLREIVAQVRAGEQSAGEARASLNEMAMRQHEWALGAFCNRYCQVVTQHHGLEDGAIFPHLRKSDERLEPVIDRLAEEHVLIHDAIEGVDRALVHQMQTPEDFGPLQAALELLTDALTSHLSYEEQELVEPLSRLGFYAGQV